MIELTQREAEIAEMIETRVMNKIIKRILTPIMISLSIFALIMAIFS